MNLVWNPNNTPSELHSILRTLGTEYALREGCGEVNLTFEKNSDPETLLVTRRGESFHVSYGRDSIAARGAAYALSGQECAERIVFKTFGILFDCTRGNVMKADSFKRWLRRLSLMGYNMAMLYTKDAYQVPGEPYFGYMRGAYSKEEMKEVDAYAKSLKIEIIASIQTLGHLEPILRWPAYGPLKDTDSVILTDEPKSYKLLEKMIAFWSEALESRRIHLGMDETHDLGRGRFMDLHGYESPFSIYNRHLKRICGICKKLKLKPIIWSDMYFRYANKNQDYYDARSKVPEEVKQAIPKEVQLSYWDYYHREAGFYEKMLLRTKDLNGSAPFMASGVWTWTRLWCDYEMTMGTVRPCVDACRKIGAKEIIYTLWGDDGGYCEFDSAFAGLAWAADYAFNKTENEDRTALLYEAVCGASYRLQLVCGNLCHTFQDRKGNLAKLSPAPLLWDDPLMGIVWNELPALKDELPDTLVCGFRKIMDMIKGHREEKAAGHLNHAWNLANVLALKLELRKRLLNAYEKRDFSALSVIAERHIPDVIAAIEELNDSFREQWLRNFKSYGLELMQIRLAGVAERYRELARVIGELLDSSITSIPELEVAHQPTGRIVSRYKDIATGGFFI